MTFEDQLNELLERAKNINPPKDMALMITEIDINEYNRPSEEWLNDVQIFCEKYLKEHQLYNRLHTILFARSKGAFIDARNCLTSISKDQDFIDEQNGITKTVVPKYQAASLPEYDVFISHANKDKDDLVEELFQSLKKLKINIFYDKDTFEWGDNWKDKIYEGTKKSEFAIIIISDNYFGREWTEKELKEFLSRQNKNGQKLILPIIHNITIEQLQQQYPSVADIQAIDSSKFSCDEIALLFAQQLIKRLKAI